MCIWVTVVALPEKGPGMTTVPHVPPTVTQHEWPAAPISVSERRRAAAKPRWNLPAIVGLLCGIAALVVTFVSAIGFVAWPLAGVGLVLGIVGVVQAIKGTTGNRGFAIGGTAVSAAVLLTTGGLLAYNTFIGIGEAGLHLPVVAGDKHTVEFVATATSDAYVHFGALGDQRAAITPGSTDPWHGQASYNTGSYLVTLTVDTRSSNLHNQIGCSILVDGDKIAENTGTTIALCTANIR